MKFTAAGDALIQRRLIPYSGMDEIREFIGRGDARFFNLETTLNRLGECYASYFSGGTYLRCAPECLDDLLSLGFNMMSFNNNHTMDFSYEGMLKTLDYVNEKGIVQAGVGRSLAEASAPAYLDTEGGKVALISVNTTFEACMLAGDASPCFPARPGINGIRWRESLLVSGTDISVIEDISDKTGVNEEMKMDIAQGYRQRLPDGVFDMGTVRFEVSDGYGNAHRANEDDVERVLKSIREARENADYVLLSLHTHEMTGKTIENIPAFIKELSHRFIDEGAHAVIGHGPHLIRAIEVYRDRPIFYSLGDFMLQLYSVEEAPEDFYKRYGLTSDVGIYELLKKRSANFTRGLMEEKIMTEAIIPYWEMEDGRLTRLELLPIECGKHADKTTEGVPMVAEKPDFIARLADISAPFGVRMHIEDGIVKCEW